MNWISILCRYYSTKIVLLAHFFILVFCERGISTWAKRETKKRRKKNPSCSKPQRPCSHSATTSQQKTKKKGHDQIQNYMSRLKHIHRWFEIKFKPNKTKRNSAQALRSNFKCLLIFWSHSPEDACLSGRRTEGKNIYILESKKQLTLNYNAWEVNPP